MKIYFFILVALFGFSQCAQQTAITGGEKDVIAPEIDTLKLENPLNGSVGFSANQIEIFFNELVVLKDPDKQIIITPFLETKPDIYTKGKKVIIDFKSALEPNTTYIINFGDAIVDITEGNIFKNYKYVFSTGSFIDSLQYSAFVYDAFLKTPEKDFLVMLYKDEADSVVNLIKPSYFGKTNATGVCTIQNIAAGNYKVVALRDLNGNYKFDPKDEKIGYIEKRFQAAQDTLADTIASFTNVPLNIEIVTSTIASNGKGLITLNKSWVSDSPIFEDSVKRLFLNEKFTVSATKDSISYWIEPNAVAQKKYPMVVGDSKKFNTYIKPPTDSLLRFTSNAFENLKPLEDLYFEFSQPIQKMDASQFTVKENNEMIAFEVVQSSLTKIIVAADYKEDADYEVKLLPNAVASYYGIVNDTIGAVFSRNNASKYGNIQLTLKQNASHQMILQLVKNEKVVTSRTITNSKINVLDFNNLTIGKYSFRLIYDANNNGVWDTGDYYRHILPERVEYYSEVLDVRKGWDMEVIWDIK